MRFASIRQMDITNGDGIGVAVFVQGCNFHCKNCFNPETWDANNGKEWKEETEEYFLKLADRPYIRRISLLGGDPLYEGNLDGILRLLKKVRSLYGDTKSIWLWTGYELEHIFDSSIHYHPQTQEKLLTGRFRREQIVKLCDYVIDGRYVDELRDISLKWRGSSNQHIYKNVDGKFLDISSEV